MPVQQVKHLLEQGYQLLDVRESDEFHAGHLADARHIPLGRLTENTVTAVLEPHLPVLAYCHKGQRSLEAVRILRGLGYESAYSLQGGITAWNASFPAEAVPVIL
jgi:rhodanese-related sulfurtransferase